jgi:hypothetical protein
MAYNLEHYEDQQLDFSFNELDYIWTGDYTVESEGEEETEYAPAYGESEVKIFHTLSLSYYDQNKDVFIEVKPTPSILIHIELLIERNL